MSKSHRLHTLTLLCLLVATDAWAGPSLPTSEPNVVRDVHLDAANHKEEITANGVTTDLQKLHPQWQLMPPWYLPATTERVYFNTATSNHKLLVFLPGCGATPDAAQQFMLRAARKGYHVIGLMYWNDCATPSCPNMDDSCLHDFRAFQYSNSATLPAVLAVGSGFGVLHHCGGLFDPADFDNQCPQDSVRHRLRRLLDDLDATFPGQGWDEFAGDGHGGFDDATHGYIDWTKVTLAAHSEGSKVAAYVAAHEVLGKALFFSGPNEHVNWLANPNPTMPRWTVQSGFKFQPGIPHTDPKHIYFFWSELDDNATDNVVGGHDGTSDGIVTNDVAYLNAKAMHVFDAPNHSSPWAVDSMYSNAYVGPYAPPHHSGYNALFATALSPSAGACGAHQSTVTDCGPNSDTLLYLSIIDYLLDE